MYVEFLELTVTFWPRIKQYRARLILTFLLSILPSHPVIDLPNLDTLLP